MERGRLGLGEVKSGEVGLEWRFDLACFFFFLGGDFECNVFLGEAVLKVGLLTGIMSCFVPGFGRQIQYVRIRRFAVAFFGTSHLKSVKKLCKVVAIFAQSISLCRT